MSENKNYKIIKTVPGDVLFLIHPVSNPMLTRRILLTEKMPVQSLPLDWALGVFQDEGVYSLYSSKCFTFNDNDDIVKEAFNAGVYFDETLDFTPAAVDNTQKIFDILKSGNRAKIEDAVKTEGVDTVKNIAIANADNLTQSVIRMLENLLKVQLIVDGE